MIQINPTQIPLRNAEVNFITMRSEFDLGGETSRVFWQVYDVEKQPITSGTIEVDSDTHLAWAEDDSFIIDFTLNNLGLTIKD